MKKSIYICALLSLLVVFTSISTNAQTTYGSEIKVPFAFSVGGQSYDAGKYVVKIVGLQGGAARLLIVDPTNDRIQQVIISANGESIDSGAVKLVFDAYNERKILTGVRTPSGSYALFQRREKPSVRVADASSSEPL